MYLGRTQDVVRVSPFQKPRKDLAGWLAGWLVSQIDRQVHEQNSACSRSARSMHSMHGGGMACVTCNP